MKIILIISVVLLRINLSAQLVSNGLISLNNEAQFSVKGDFTNKGQLTNNGRILISGNWMNVGVYDDDEGMLLFNGTEDQVISNNAQVINDLELRGAGNKILMDDATITGTLRFEAGKLVVPEGITLLMKSDVTIWGTDDNSYIIGKVAREGVGELFFPVGTVNHYLPVTLKNVNGNNPAIGMEAFSQRPHQTSGPDVPQLSENAYWVMSKDEKYINGFIQLPYSNEVFIGDPSRLVVAQASDLASLFHTIGASELLGDTEMGLITSSGFATGSYFTIGYQPEIPILPPITVINALTPLQDGKHDFLRIENIELYENNKVEIFNRSGDKVFSLANYNNSDRVFRGEANTGIGNELADGTYFYTIKMGKSKVSSGFLFLKR